MPKSLLFLVLASFTCFPAATDAGQPKGLGPAIQQSERVVVANVVAVQPYWRTNKWGDRLIVSRTWVRPSETLKGAHTSGDVPVDIEGGTIQNLTLHVSDLPVVAKGERAVFLLRREPDGRFTPSGRGAGVLKLTANDQVVGTTLRLEDVRRAAAAGR
jgi:hypothetical protein